MASEAPGPLVNMLPNVRMLRHAQRSEPEASVINAPLDDWRLYNGYLSRL